MFDPFFPLGVFLGPLALSLVYHFETSRPDNQRLPSWKSIVCALVAVWGLPNGVLLALFLLIAGSGPLSEEIFMPLVWVARVASVLLIAFVYFWTSRRRSQHTTSVAE